MITKRTVLLSCFILLGRLVFGQQLNTADTLTEKSFEYIENKIFEHPNDTASANKYAHLYIKKARKIGNLRKEIDGFYILSIINDRQKSLIYSDSALHYSKKYKIKDWLPIIFLNKGNIFYTNNEDNKAVQNYLLARKEVDVKNQPDLYQSITANIAHIKSTIGKNDEALLLYKEALKNNNLSVDTTGIELDNHLDLLFGLADSYKKNNLLDSATTYNHIGVLKSKKYKKELYYSKFVLNEATNLFQKKRYGIALDSVNIAIPLLEKSTDSINLAIAYLQKGKILDFQKNEEEALLFFKKTDSIIAEKNTSVDYFTEVYDWLYNYYKKKGNLEYQLFYLEKLIAYNTKVATTYRFVNEKIQKEFDTPNLLLEKETLIGQLEAQNKYNSIQIVLLSVALGTLLIFSFYYYRNRMVYKKRYEKLLLKNPTPKGSKRTESTAAGSSLKIPESVVTSIISNLDSFEKEGAYLANSITLLNLAKDFKTNANYLSKVINLVKNKNFSTYISDLRINHSIKEIRSNPKLLNYKVKALAQEFGFGNAESFTKAFYKKTGIYPSYYIKQLKKGTNEPLSP